MKDTIKGEYKFRENEMARLQFLVYSYCKNYELYNYTLAKDISDSIQKGDTDVEIINKDGKIDFRENKGLGARYAMRNLLTRMNDSYNPKWAETLIRSIANDGKVKIKDFMFVQQRNNMNQSFKGGHIQLVFDKDTLKIDVQVDHDKVNNLEHVSMYQALFNGLHKMHYSSYQSEGGFLVHTNDKKSRIINESRMGEIGRNGTLDEQFMPEEDDSNQTVITSSLST